MALTALATAFLTVRLSARGSSVVVPLLTGMDMKQVKHAMLQKGLEMAISGEDFSETYPAGCVIAQQPAAGSRLKRGRRVKLTLSRGSEVITMPPLRDLAQPDAEFLVRQMDLDLVSAAQTPAGAPKRTVIAQDPPPGEKVVRGSPVRILVSDGPAQTTIVMPNVAGATAREALERLRAMNLKISEVTYETTTLYTGGMVISQDPPGGFRVTPGEEVRLRAALRTSEGIARYATFNYAVAPGPARRLRVVIVDEGGSREITNEIEEGGSTLRLSARVQGEAVAQFFVGGTLAEERKL
jgi:eukaryotic-like serine/threonine-protein kinase